MLGGCQSRTLTTQDPEPVVGESVVEPDPEPVEQEPQIPDDAPGFYTTRQEMNGWEVFSLSTAQDLIDLSDWVQGGEDTAGRIFVLEDNIDLGGVDFVPIGTRENPFRGAFPRPGVQRHGLERHRPRLWSVGGIVWASQLRDGRQPAGQRHRHRLPLGGRTGGLCERLHHRKLLLHRQRQRGVERHRRPVRGGLCQRVL